MSRAASPIPRPYRAKDGTTTWRVRLRVAGRQTSETFTTEVAAKGFAARVADIGAAAAIAERARRDIAADEYVPTLAEWLPQYIDQLTGVTDRTRLDYARIAERTWLPRLGALPLDLITRADVAAWVNAADRAGLSGKTIANAKSLLSAALAAAVLAGRIDANPAFRMRTPRGGEEERRDERFLTHEEYGRLYAATPDQWRPLVVLLFGTGARWSEATALQVRDLHLYTSPPTLHIVRAWKTTPGAGRKVGPPKSRKSRRTVMLGAPVAEHLAPLASGRAADDLLITGPRGGPVWPSIWRERVWVPACIAAGLATLAIPFDGPRVHDARHTCASWLIEQGATLEMVQDHLGHESILTTRKVYGHLQPAMRQQMAAMATRALLGQVRQIEP